MKIISSFVELETGEGIALHDLMPDIKNAVAKSGITNGFVTVTSQEKMGRYPLILIAEER